MGRILCLDMGEKRIGIAVSDALRWIASPHSVYSRVGYGPDVRHMQRLMQELDGETMVIGLPRNMDGSLGASAQKAQAFAEKLTESGIPVVFWDERLSTVSAQRSLIEGGMRREQRRETVDKVAAAVILQSYLDAQRSQGNHMTHAASNAGVDKTEDNMASKDKKDKLEEVAAKETADTAAYEDELDEGNNLIELTDEDGVTTLFEYLTTIPHEGNEYVVLMVVPEDGEEDTEADDEADDDDEGEVVILKIESDENGEDMYVTCDDEAISQKVFELFMEQIEAEED